MWWIIESWSNTASSSEEVEANTSAEKPNPSGKRIEFSVFESVRTNVLKYQWDSSYLKFAQTQLKEIDKNWFENMDSGYIESAIKSISKILEKSAKIGDDEAFMIYEHVSQIMKVYQSATYEKDIVKSEAQEKKDRELSKQKMKELTGIDIYGSNSALELEGQIDNFKSKLLQWKIWRGLTNQERDSVIRQLDDIIDGKKNAEKIWYAQIEAYFDTLGDNIQLSGGKYSIELEPGVQKSFDSKEKAFEFIIDLKSKAEHHFQWLTRTILEYAFVGTIGAVWKTEKFVFSPIPYLLSGVRWSTDSLDIVISMFWLAATFAVTTAIVGSHIAVWESIYRRVIKDNIQKFDSWKQMSDFWRPWAVSPVDINSDEWKDFTEYKQRQQLIDLLWADLESNHTPGSDKYIEYRKQIQSIDSFKLNRTPTFYYLAYKYWKLSGKGERFLNTIMSLFIRGGKFLYPKVALWGNGNKTIKNFLKFWNYKLSVGGINFDDSKRLAGFTIDALIDDEEIQKGIDIFYKNKKVERASDGTEPPKIEIKGDDKKTSKYQYYIDEINSRDIPQKKKEKLIGKFQDYVKKLVEFPKSWSVIARDLYVLIETDYGNKNDFLAQLDARIKRLAARDGTLKNNMWRIRWSESQRLRTYSKVIASWEWVGSEKEFEAEVKKIKDLPLYNVKPNGNNRLGGIDFKVKLTDTLENWKKFGIKHSSAVSHFYSTDKVGHDHTVIAENHKKVISFEWAKEARTSFMWYVMEYIEYGPDNDLETTAKTEIGDLFDGILSGKIIINDEKILFAEVYNIFGGNISSYKAVNKLTIIAENHKDSKKITDIEDLLKLAKQHKLNITPEELEQLSRSPDSFDFAKNRNRVKDKITKTVLDKQIENTKWWSASNYNKSLWLDEKARSDQYFTKLKEQYKKELELIHIIDHIDNSTQQARILWELNTFSKDLAENRFSTWQADYVLKNIFAWKNYADINLPALKDTGKFYEGTSHFAQVAKKQWEALDPGTQAAITEKVADDNSLDRNKLPTVFIQQAVDDFIKSPEKNKDTSTRKWAIKSMINEINHIWTSDDLEKLKQRFDTYIDDTAKIDRTDPKFESMIKQFQQEISIVRWELDSDGIRINPSRAPILEVEIPKTLHDEADEIVERIFLYAEISWDKIDSISQRQLLGQINEKIDSGEYTGIPDIKKHVAAFELKSMEEIVTYIKVQVRISEDIADSLDSAAKTWVDDLITFIRKNLTQNKFGKIISR